MDGMRMEFVVVVKVHESIIMDTDKRDFRGSFSLSLISMYLHILNLTFYC